MEILESPRSWSDPEHLGGALENNLHWNCLVAQWLWPLMSRVMRSIDYSEPWLGSRRIFLGNPACPVVQETWEIVSIRLDSIKPLKASDHLRSQAINDLAQVKNKDYESERAMMCFVGELCGGMLSDPRLTAVSVLLEHLKWRLWFILSSWGLLLKPPRRTHAPAKQRTARHGMVLRGALGRPAVWSRSQRASSEVTLHFLLLCGAPRAGKMRQWAQAAQRSWKIN